MSGRVLIVGAGPTGLTIAHELARDGIQCRVIDKVPHRAKKSRAIAIHSRTLETFELMKIVDDFLAKGQQITSVRIYGDRGPIAHIGLDAIESRYPFVLGVPQDETERIGITKERALVGRRDRVGEGQVVHSAALIGRCRADGIDAPRP